MLKSGTVKYVNARPFGNKTLHSFKLENDGIMYALGEKRPNIQVGDNISFDHGPIQNDRASVEFNSITVVAGEPAPRPAASPFQRSPAAIAKDDYWRAKEARDIASEPIIRQQAARRDAISLVCTMVEKDLIPLPAKGDKITAVLGIVSDFQTKFLEALEATKEQDEPVKDIP